MAAKALIAEGKTSTRNGGASDDGKRGAPPAWKDLPRRLLTVALGVPSIVLLLRRAATSWLFFQGAHSLCLLEWRALVPPPAGNRREDAAPNGGRPRPRVDDDDDAAARERASGAEGNASRAVPTRMIGVEPPADSSPLSNCIFYLFCLFSLLITVSPTPLLPLELMSYAVAVRLLPHLPGFQSADNPANSEIFLAMQQHYQFGILYLSLGFHFILRISQMGGPAHIGNLLFVVWMSDTGALISGRFAKKRKKRKKRKNDAVDERSESDRRDRRGIFLSFLKSISPGKTLPGLLGAVITGPLSALIYPIALPSSTTDSSEQCDGGASFISSTLQLCRRFHHPRFQKIILGLLLSLAGIAGDLAESAVKRLSQKKDSGGLLPRHGGVVDRFDSLLVAGVCYYYFVPLD